MTEVGASSQSPGVRAASVTASGEPLAALYQSEVGWVWNALKRLGAPSADLEDLAHDVFLAAHHARARFDPARPARPWLMGIAFRVLSTSAGSSDTTSRCRVTRSPTRPGSTTSKGPSPTGSSGRC